MKKFLSVLLSAVLCFSCAAVAFADEDDFRIEDGVLIDYYGDDDKVVVPAGVTTLGDSCFEYSRMTELVLPESLEVIEYCALENCTNLKTVTLPKNVREIELFAFIDNTSLTAIQVAAGNRHFKSVDGVLYDAPCKTLVRFPEGKSADGFTLPATVTVIGDGAFYGCDLTEIDLTNVTSIGEDAFGRCESLRSVTLGTGLTSVGAGAFSESALQEVRYAGSSLQWDKIDIDAYGNVKLTDAQIHFAGGDYRDFEIDDDGRLTAYKGDADKVVVPDFVKVLGDGCLSGKQMKELSLPEGLEVIEDWAISSCKNLTTVTIPKSVKEIGSYVFDFDSNLTGIKVASGSPYFKSADGVLFDKAGTLILKFPEGKTTAGYQLPDTVKTIGSGAFYATDLTGFTVGDNVEEIRCWAFSDCPNLTGLTLGQGLKTLGDHVFAGSTGLTTLTLPASLEEIGTFTFDNSRGLQSIHAAKGSKHFASVDGVLYSSDMRILVKYPEGRSAKDYTLPDTVTKLGAGALTRSDFTEIDLTGVTYIDDYALNECKQLKTVYLGAGLARIGYGAFVHDDALKTVWYEGNSDTWDAIAIDGDNAELTNADLHCTGDGDVPPPARPGIIGEPWKPEDLPPAGNIIYSDDWGDELPYTLDDNGTLTISGSGATFGYVTVEFQTGWWSPGMPLPTWSPLHYYKDDIRRVVLTNGLTVLGQNVFYQCSRITDVYFDGTEEEWNAIDIREGNETLTGATIHFKYTDPAVREIAVSPLPAGEQAPAIDTSAFSLNAGLDGGSKTGELRYAAGQVYAYDCYFTLTTGAEGGEYTFRFPANGRDDPYRFTAEPYSAYRLTYTYGFTAGNGTARETVTFEKPDGSAGSKEVSVSGGVLRKGYLTITQLRQDAPPHVHDWAAPVYTWSKNNSAVTATRACRAAEPHTETETVTAEKTVVPATCETAGKTVYTAVFTNPAFAGQTKEIAIPATGHDWNKPTYTWSADNSAVSATRVCKNDAAHAQTETVSAATAVTPATCTADGKTVCTATFTNPAFAGQTKETAIPATGHDWGEITYTWRADNSAVTATRVCRNDAAHKQTETANAVPTETEPGKITYTAVFTNPAFAAQTKVTQSGAQRLPGDVDNDGKVTSADARLALRASVKLEKDIVEGTDAFRAADVTGDGVIKAEDARFILRASVHLEDLNQLKRTA